MGDLPKTVITVNTKAYGPVEVDERQQIHFPSGILGFENFHDFVLLDAAQPPFLWLQSMEVREIAFVLISPAVFRKDYTLDIMDSDLKEIGLSTIQDEDLISFAIVTIPEDQNDMTANLQGPIIINRQQKLGRQSISTNNKWQTRHFILKELAGKEGS